MTDRIFTHYKNKKQYKITDSCKIQEDGIWVDAVIYHAISNPKLLFVRTEKEFEEKFNGNAQAKFEETIEILSKIESSLFELESSGDISASDVWRFLNNIQTRVARLQTVLKDNE